MAVVFEKPKALTDAVFHYCPGCTHGIIHRLVAEAIDTLVQGLENGIDAQVLLGVTGSGKTFTMANVIARVNRPTLVLAHNKTLAAQLCSEFREFFPENRAQYIRKVFFFFFFFYAAP